MITKDLGMVTAYAYAVSKGYTGTETEFAELMASYATVAQEAVDAALAAAQSAQSARDAQTAAEGARDTAQTTVSGAIAGIQAEGQTQIGVVQSEGTAQVGNVNSAGQTQVGNVNAAGANQVDAVQAKGAEVLDSIPSDYTALSGEVSGLKSAITQNTNISPAGTATGGYIGGDGTWKSSSSFNVKKYPVNAGDVLYLEIGFPFSSSGGVFQFQSNYSIPSSSNSYIIGSTYRAAFTGSLTVPEGATFLMVTVKANVTDTNVIQRMEPKNSETVNKVDAIEKNQAFGYSDYGGDYVSYPSSGFGYTKKGPVVQIDGERTGSVTVGVSLTTDTLVSINNVTTDSSFTNPNLKLKAGRKYLAKIKLLSGSITNTSESARSHDFKLCYYDGTTATSEVLRSITLSGNQTLNASAIPEITKRIAPVEDIQCGFIWACRGYLIASGFSMIFSIDDVTDYQVSLATGSDIVMDNTDATNKILASRWLRSTTAVPLTLLTFSDIHRDKKALERVVQYMEHLKGLNALDDTIALGDQVQSSSYEASDQTYFSSFWDGTPGTEGIMFAIGNHEWYAQGSQPHGKIGLNSIVSLFLGGSDNWDVERSSGNSFFYKDYADQGIRLIVTDPAIENEADETTWLQTTLAGAKTLGYSVVVASHTVRANQGTETDSMTVIANNWTDNVTKANETIQLSYDWTGSCDIVKCVSDFITAGGSFLCYLIGHQHWDRLMYPTGHPDQLIICVASANPDRTQTKLSTNDLPRYADTRTHDCFNVVTFDAVNKIIKCVRVGSNMTMYEQPRTAFAYDVTNHTFINVI